MDPHLTQPKGVSRRDFLKLTVAGGAALMLPVPLMAAPHASDVWVIHSTDPEAMMGTCLDVIRQNGGLGGKAGKLALKVNAAWARTPKQGANTHPVLVETFLKGARKLGMSTLDVPEHPCNRAAQAFERSGISSAVKEAGGTMYDMKSENKLFREVQIPKGKKLKTAKVTQHFLEADVIVNMPVAKHHGGATLSMAMKNWMGAVEDRRFWHRNDLHQCIADFSSFMRPHWTVVDATRCMLDRGPQGPAKNMKHPNLLIVSKDQIAADAYATMLFDKKPEDIGYLKAAGAMKLGMIDLDAMAIHKIEA